MSNPYIEALELVQQHDGTSGQSALAKCILSLYNPIHAFSLGEILGPLDELYTRVVLAMVKEYAEGGETEELRRAGKWVYSEFPRLIELSEAMQKARGDVRHTWERNRAEENRQLYPNG